MGKKTDGDQTPSPYTFAGRSLTAAFVPSGGALPASALVSRRGVPFSRPAHGLGPGVVPSPPEDAGRQLSRPVHLWSAASSFLVCKFACSVTVQTLHSGVVPPSSKSRGWKLYRPVLRRSAVSSLLVSQSASPEMALRFELGLSIDETRRVGIDTLRSERPQSAVNAIRLDSGAVLHRPAGSEKARARKRPETCDQ